MGIVVSGWLSDDQGCESVWEDERNVYIFEFKYGKSAQEAFDQIITKKYHVPYLKKGKRVIGIGLNWTPDKERRGLTHTRKSPNHQSPLP